VLFVAHDETKGDEIVIFSVDIIESELGWGQRVDEVKTFDSKDYGNDADKAYEAAAKFVKEYNSKNNLLAVPNWYMYATEPVQQRKVQS
jgi:hypothetical protein